MSAMENCGSKKDFMVKEFTIELSDSELQSTYLNKTYIFSEGDIIFNIKNKSNLLFSLMLESCKNKECILKVNVSMFLYSNDSHSWDEVPFESRTILPPDFNNLPMEIMQLREVRKKIKFEIYSKNKFMSNVCYDCSNMNDMAKSYGTLMKDEKSSDVTLIVGSERFLAHKLILFTQSPVFAAMFSSDMLEKQKGEVEIKDIEAPILKFLLEFIYTYRISNDGGNKASINWLELMLAADKYAVEALKRICSLKLAENLSSDDALDVLVIADRIKDDELKKISASFIIRNKNEIFDTEKFQEFLKSNTDIVVELFKDLMSKKYSIAEDLFFINNV